VTLLPHENLLTTTCGVAAAFVGFSLVVSLLRPVLSGDRWQILAIRNVAEIGLIVIGSFLPLVIHAYGWSRDHTWRSTRGRVLPEQRTCLVARSGSGAIE